MPRRWGDIGTAPIFYQDDNKPCLLTLYFDTSGEYDCLRNMGAVPILHPVKPLKFHLPDPDDEPFLEVALSGGTEAIVTGNKRHFPRKEYEGIKILSPAEFIEVLKNKI